ncbi:small ribosomal subunit protein uS17-like [Thomomys bottae]
MGVREHSDRVCVPGVAGQLPRREEDAAGREWQGEASRYYKTPTAAIEGTYIDKKCLFTGTVSIRGRILSGVVTRMKMQRTVVHYIRKCNRFEKHHKNMSVHLSPCFRDNIITVSECQPLSKTVRFNMLKAAGTKKQFQKL